MSPPGELTGLAADQAFNARVKMVTLDLADPSLVFRGVNVQPLRLPSECFALHCCLCLLSCQDSQR